MKRDTGSASLPVVVAPACGRWRRSVARSGQPRSVLLTLPIQEGTTLR
jgi:hypothetical protein